MTRAEQDAAEDLILRLHQRLDAERLSATVRLVASADGQPKLRVSSVARGAELDRVRAVVAQVLTETGVNFEDLMVN